MTQSSKDEIAELREEVAKLSNIVLEHVVKPRVEESPPAQAITPDHLNRHWVRDQIVSNLETGECFSVRELARSVFGTDAANDEHKKKSISNNARALHEKGDIACASLRGSGDQKRVGLNFYAKDVETLAEALRDTQSDGVSCDDITNAYWEAVNTGSVSTKELDVTENDGEQL